MAVNLTLTANTGSGTNATSYTFTSAALGAAASDRYTVVGAAFRVPGAASSFGTCSVAGVTSTFLINGSPFATFDPGSGIFHSATPTGTTGDVVVAFTATVNNCYIGVWRVTGHNPTAADAQIDKHTSASQATSSSVTLTHTAGAGIVAITQIEAAEAIGWTGLATKDFDVDAESSNQTSGASEVKSGAGPTTVTESSVSSTSRCLTAVAFNVAAAGGPTTKTIITDLDALIQHTNLTAAVDIDTLLTRVVDVTVDLDALLQKQNQSTADIDALLSRLAQTRTVELDALLQIARTVDLDINAILLLLGSQSIDIDALLQLLGQTQLVNLDALLQKAATLTVSVDALLQIAQSRQISIDAILISQAPGTLPILIDALLQATRTISTNIDALLSFARTRTLSIDAVLKATLTRQIDLDGLLQRSRVVTAQIDAVLKQLGRTITSDIDALLQKSFSIQSQLDAILIEPVGTISVDVDSVLTRLGLSLSASMDAILRAAVLTPTTKRIGVVPYEPRSSVVPDESRTATVASE